MKKEFFYYSILTIVIALLLFFETNIFETENENASKVIEIESFEKLEIDLECNIYVSIGEEQRVVFEGPGSCIDMVETSLENGVLTITSKKPNLFSSLFSSNESPEEPLNVYVKLTSAEQLIAPVKGNLITSETSLYMNINEPMNMDQGIRTLLKILGNQLGNIRIL